MWYESFVCWARTRKSGDKISRKHLRYISTHVIYKNATYADVINSGSLDIKLGLKCRVLDWNDDLDIDRCPRLRNHRVKQFIDGQCTWAEKCSQSTLLSLQAWDCKISFGRHVVSKNGKCRHSNFLNFAI